jgi:hypothetical protein
MDFTLSKPETSFARLSLSLSPPSRTSKLCSPSEGEEEKGRKKNTKYFRENNLDGGRRRRLKGRTGLPLVEQITLRVSSWVVFFLKPDGAFSGNL